MPATQFTYNMFIQRYNAGVPSYATINYNPAIKVMYGFYRKEWNLIKNSLQEKTMRKTRPSNDYLNKLTSVATICCYKCVFRKSWNWMQQFSVFIELSLFNLPAHSEDRPGQPCNQGWRSLGCLRCRYCVPFWQKRVRIMLVIRNIGK